MSDKKKGKPSKTVSKEVANLIKTVCFDYEEWLRDRIKELGRISRGEKVRQAHTQALRRVQKTLRKARETLRKGQGEKSMLFDEVKNKVVLKVQFVMHEQRENNGSVYLHTDRYFRKIQESFSLSELFEDVSAMGYSWDWISPILERALDLNGKDMLELARAISSNYSMVTDVMCDLCGED